MNHAQPFCSTILELKLTSEVETRPAVKLYQMPPHFCHLYHPFVVSKFPAYLRPFLPERTSRRRRKSFSAPSTKRVESRERARHKERCSERACSPRILGFPLPPDAKSGYLPWFFIGHHTRGRRGSVSRAVSPSRYCRVLKGPGKEWAHLNPDFLRLRPPAACGFGFSNHACTPTNRTQSEV